jgi:hypothetical protein
MSFICRKDTYTQHRALLESISAFLETDGIAFISFAHRPCASHTAERDMEFFITAAEYGLTSQLIESKILPAQDNYSYGTDKETLAVFLYTLTFHRSS